MAVQSISLKKFNILAAYTRRPTAFLLSEELEHLATEGDRVLDVLIRDRIDGDYLGLVLGKDESGQYRCVDPLTCTNFYDSARDELIAALENWHLRPDEDFFQGEPKKPFLDVFLPVVPPEQLNEAFLQVATTESFTAARRVVESMIPFFQDVDGNFIEQFQTTAFDACVWELCLFAALTELKVVFDRAYNAPDYLCDFFGYQFFVEATTVNPTTKNGIVVEPDPTSMDKEKLIYGPYADEQTAARKLADLKQTPRYATLQGASPQRVPAKGRYARERFVAILHPDLEREFRVFP
jgi:hypothetical protein